MVYSNSIQSMGRNELAYSGHLQKHLMMLLRCNLGFHFLTLTVMARAILYHDNTGGGAKFVTHLRNYATRKTSVLFFSKNCMFHYL